MEFTDVAIFCINILRLNDDLSRGILKREGKEEFKEAISSCVAL